MNFGASTLIARTNTGIANTIAVIIPPVTAPLEITLILAPAGVLFFHRLVSESSYEPANRILTTTNSGVVFQAQFLGTGIPMEIGESIAVSASANAPGAISIYGVPVMASNI